MSAIIVICADEAIKYSGYVCFNDITQNWEMFGAVAAQRKLLNRNLCAGKESDQDPGSVMLREVSKEGLRTKEGARVL